MVKKKMINVDICFSELSQSQLITVLVIDPQPHVGQ